MPAITPSWTRLVRFIASEDSQEHYGEPIDASLDIGLAHTDGVEVKLFEIEASHPWDETAVVHRDRVLTLKKLLSPLSAAEVGTIRAIGLNYSDHAAEMGLPHPALPVQFLKPPSTVANPGAVVEVPLMAQDDQVDWEVELAIVIGRQAKNVSEEDALDYVLGYTVANDLSARKIQVASSQWCHAKVFDGFNPLGPALVARHAIPDPAVLKLQTTVNGVTKQDGTAARMIFGVAQLVSFLSQGSTLAPGTTIITGTPPGVGSGRKPIEWLKDGDDVRVAISHGIGTLRNTIAYEKRVPQAKI